MKFPDLVHASRKHPSTNLRDPEMFWDFVAHCPESLHQLTYLYSNRGTPDGYCFMNTYSANTFKWVNPKGEAFYVRFQLKCDQGVRNLTSAEAEKLGKNPDYAS